jgi:dsDNA-binding SOS-regulon protein
MAVVTLYMSDRDKTGRTFVSKKDADEHDKKLELAENLSVFLGQRLSFLNEKQVEDIGFMLAEHRELLAQALKGKPEVLLDTELASPGETAAEEVVDVSSEAEAAEVQVADVAVTDKKVRAIGR